MTRRLAVVAARAKGWPWLQRDLNQTRNARCQVAVDGKRRGWLYPGGFVSCTADVHIVRGPGCAPEKLGKWSCEVTISRDVDTDERRTRKPARRLAIRGAKRARKLRKMEERNAKD